MTWPLLVVKAIAWIALSVATSYLMRRSSASDPTAPGDVEGTTVDSASPIPVLFGTRLMSQPNCIWYGDVGTTAIKSSGGKK